MTAAFAGRPWQVAAVHRNVRTLFRGTIDGLPGNDDLGGLSAWHVFSALGFGPVTPGAPLYVVGRPVFDAVSLGNGTVVTTSGRGRFVAGARLDGGRLRSSWFDGRAPHRLDLRLDRKPTWRASPPPSASVDALTSFGCA